MRNPLSVLCVSLLTALPTPQQAEKGRGAPGAVIVAEYVKPDYAAYWFKVLSVERFDKLASRKDPDGLYKRFYKNFLKRSKTLERYHLLEIEVGNTWCRDEKDAASKQAALDRKLKKSLKPGSTYILAWPSTVGVSDGGVVVEKKLGMMDGFDLHVFDYSKEALGDIDKLFPEALKESNANHGRKVVPDKIDPSLIAGTRVLMRCYDPFTLKPEEEKKQLEEALRKAKVKILKNDGNYLLLDCGGKDPERLVKGIPYQEGAIIFKDGIAWKTVVSHDQKKHIDKDCAVMYWGSTSSAFRQMALDIATYTNMQGVVAKVIENKKANAESAGNSTRMELRPAEGSTLLQVFLWAEAEFKDTEQKADR